MIYKFNEYSEEKRYPKRVSLKQIEEKRRIHEMVDFTECEKQKIIEILEERKIRYKLNSNFIEIFKFGGSEIVKHSDNWFTVVSCLYYQKIEYFICDEFEEVETYLNIML